MMMLVCGGEVIMAHHHHRDFAGANCRQWVIRKVLV